MVECEYVDGDANKSGVAVLIDTWWNVNYHRTGHYRFLCSVLIDTWWNVNDCACLFLQNEVHSFNRYMVECECGSILVDLLL